MENLSDSKSLLNGKFYPRYKQFECQYQLRTHYETCAQEYIETGTTQLGESHELFNSLVEPLYCLIICTNYAFVSIFY